MDEPIGEVALASWAPDGGFVRQLRQRKAVLFAGAGLSAAAGLPGWAALLKRVADAQPAMPAARREEFDVLLQADCLLDAASLLRELAGEAAFQATLVSALKGGKPTALHRAMASVPWRLIVTTNFDDLLERTLPGWPSLTHRDAPEIARLLNDEQPFILKAHGDVARPQTIVLDRRDFARMVWGREDFQRMMSALLLTSPVVFAGYSHADEDFDLLMLEHVELFGLAGARRYALLQVKTVAERAQIAVLRRKGIQVLAYQEHGEVPAAFERMAALVADAAEGVQAPAADGAGPAFGPRAGRPLRTPSAAVARPGRPRVIVVPGLFGSELAARHDGAGKARRIWLNYIGLMAGRFAALGLAGPASRTPRVAATELLDIFYGPAFEILTQSFAVEAFAYDWRLDLHDSADALARFLEDEVGDGPPCHVVAHGEGGLVAQLCAAQHPALWAKRRAGIGRLVCLGTPWHGQFESLRLLLGSNPMQQKLALLDLRHGLPELRRIFSSFPAVYQTLPSPHHDAAWQVLYRAEHYADGLVDPALLALAERTHARRAGLPLPPGLINVLGQAPMTVDAFAMDGEERLDRSSSWIGTARGDGVVTHTSAQLPGAPAYFADVTHDALLADRRTAAALVDLLHRGETDHLPREPTPQPR